MKVRQQYSEAVLEKIARTIGTFFSGTQILALLKKAGVPGNWIDYPNTKWKILKDVFEKYSEQKNGAQRITTVITVFTHPLNHWEEEKSCDRFRKEVEKYLSYDSLSLVCETNGQCDIKKLIPAKKNGVKQKQVGFNGKKLDKGDVFQSIEFWECYKDTYKRFMQIIEIFFKEKNSLDDDLDDAYRRLKETLTQYTEVFNPYIPFDSLFSAEKEWADYVQENVVFGKTRFHWDSFRPRIQDTYSKILTQLDDRRKATGISNPLSLDQIDTILNKHPGDTDSKEFIQKMEVTHKFSGDSPTKKSKKTLSSFEAITFENEDLYFDKERVPLIKHKIGKQVAGFMIQKDPNEKVDWSEIYDGTIGYDSEVVMPKKDDGWRKIRDASEEINNKVIKELGLKQNEKFIEWDQNCFWRTI